jgi:hypothetical protein
MSSDYPMESDSVQSYSTQDFGDTYYDYLGLLGTIAYLNSNELFTDGSETGPYTTRTYPQWCQNPKIKGIIDSHLNSLLSGSQPQVIYTTQLNDTQDIVKMHKYLSDLKAFEGLGEVPVFDVKEFNIKWKGVGPDNAVLANPFGANGLPIVPKHGLKADAYPGLNNTYSDVFYQAILDVAVMQPSLTFDGAYAYSNVRIPVNTRGVTGKVYGMRPGTIYSFNAENSPTEVTMPRDGSKGLTYTQMGVGIGALYVPVLAYLMYRNFGAGYRNRKWQDFV